MGLRGFFFFFSFSFSAPAGSDADEEEAVVVKCLLPRADAVAGTGVRKACTDHDDGSAPAYLAAAAAAARAREDI